jgi:hypothetical protein
MNMPATTVALSATGKRVGESHPKATLTDHEVDLLLELRDEGFSLSWLAEKFEIAKTTAHSIVTGRTRATQPATYRTQKPHVRGV